MKKKHLVSKIIISSALLMGIGMSTVSVVACNPTHTVTPQEEAQKVIDKINALTNESSEEEVVGAREAYEKLSEEAKGLISQSVLNKLRQQEARIADQKAAKVVEDAINALSATPTRAEVQPVRNAYNALTNAQKAYVSQQAVAKLQAAEKYVSDMEAVKAVEDLVDAFGEAPTIAQVDAAKAAYDLLTDDQKALFSAAKKETLDNWVAAKEELRKQAKRVGDSIEALTDQSTEQDVAAVRAAYNALTEEAKGLISAEVVAKLVAQETRIANEKAAKAVIDKINALGDTPTETAVEEARAAFEALTNEQKAIVPSEVLDKLVNAETYVADVKATGLVSDAIDALDEESTLAQIVVVSEAYNALSDAAKAMVSQERKDKLATYTQKVEKVIEVCDAINALTNESTEEAVVAAREKYEELSGDEKILVPEEVLAKLVAQEQRIVDEKAAQVVIEMIEELSDTPTETEVETVEEAYLALTVAQRELVPEESVEKLAKAREYVNAKKAAQAVDDAYVELGITTLEGLNAEQKAEVILKASSVIAQFNALSDEAKEMVECADNLEAIQEFGYVVYGDAEGDTITAYDDKSEVKEVSIVNNSRFGNVYKVDFETANASVNTSYTLDGLLWKGKTIATDVDKLIMFAANNATKWGGPGDDCNVAKLNNGYGNIGSVQLDHDGTWASMTINLTVGEGLVSDFTCYGFQEKWGGMNQEGSIYFSRLVGLYPVDPSDEAAKIDAAYEALNVPPLDDPSEAEKGQAILVASEVVAMYNAAETEVQEAVQHADEIETIESFGYVVYGDTAGDTISAYDGKSEVSGVSVVKSVTYGNVYKADISTQKTTVNLTFTLDALLSKDKTIAKDAEKLMMFAANEATLWGGFDDDCNVAKLNNNYGTIASVQLDHEGTWVGMTANLTLGEGLASEFTCYGFQEKWGGMKSVGSIYFTRLVALYPAE